MQEYVSVAKINKKNEIDLKHYTNYNIKLYKLKEVVKMY